MRVSPGCFAAMITLTSCVPHTDTIWSQQVCPWCFIGKRRLESAIAELCAEWPNVACTLQWAPYFLTPGRPPKPRNKLNGYVKRLGNEVGRR